MATKLNPGPGQALSCRSAGYRPGSPVAVYLNFKPTVITGSGTAVFQKGTSEFAFSCLFRYLTVVTSYSSLTRCAHCGRQIQSCDKESATNIETGHGVAAVAPWVGHERGPREALGEAL